MRYDRHSNDRRGVRHVGRQPRGQALGVSGFSTSNHYRTAVSTGGPQGSASMTVIAFLRFNGAAAAIQSVVSRLIAATGGYNLGINTSSQARFQVIDGALATQAATSASMAALAGFDVLLHGTLGGGQAYVYVDGTAGAPAAVTGYTAAGSVRFGLGISSVASPNQPAENCELYGAAICESTALSQAQISEHVLACRVARRMVAPPGCSYLYDGEDGHFLPSNWAASVGSWDVPIVGTPTGSRRSIRWA